MDGAEEGRVCEKMRQRGHQYPPTSTMVNSRLIFSARKKINLSAGIVQIIQGEIQIEAGQGSEGNFNMTICVTSLVPLSLHHTWHLMNLQGIDTPLNSTHPLLLVLQLGWCHFLTSDRKWGACNHGYSLPNQRLLQ